MIAANRRQSLFPRVRVNNFYELGRTYSMKKYMTPEMEVLTFAAEDGIAGILPSNIFNDGEFGGW